jgi:predicted phosphoribosyltransferase
MLEEKARFDDRAEGGRELARSLQDRRGEDAVVLGLARGGVPVGFEIARLLELPLDVLVVRKLGFPGQPELALGAVASGGSCVLNTEVLAASGFDSRTLRVLIAHASDELARSERSYRRGRGALSPRGRTAIVVDDGLATGASMMAAVASLRRQRARWVLAAVPVAPPDVCRLIARSADEVLCAHAPGRFRAVGCWYRDFSQTSDGQVRELLGRAARAAASSPPG